MVCWNRVILLLFLYSNSHIPVSFGERERNPQDLAAIQTQDLKTSFSLSNSKAHMI